MKLSTRTWKHFSLQMLTLTFRIHFSLIWLFNISHWCLRGGGVWNVSGLDFCDAWYYGLDQWSLLHLPGCWLFQGWMISAVSLFILLLFGSILFIRAAGVRRSRRKFKIRFSWRFHAPDLRSPAGAAPQVWNESQSLKSSLQSGSVLFYTQLNLIITLWCFTFNVCCIATHTTLF